LGSYYRPLTTMSLALDYQIWRLYPFGYHLTNILMHALNSMLFFFLIFSLFKDIKASFMAAVLFAVHPLNSVSVFYVSDRGTLLSCAFMLSSILSIIGVFRDKRKIGYLCGVVFFVFALLSKESAVLLPLYLLLVLYCFSAQQRKKIWIIFLVGVLISIIYLQLRQADYPMISFFASKTSGQLDAGSVKSFIAMAATYLFLSIVPFGIDFFRKIPVFHSLWAYAAIVFLVCLTLFALKKKCRPKVFSFSLLWVFAGLFVLYPLMFSRPHLGLIMQDNWIYFSSIGFFIVFSEVFHRNIKQRRVVLLSAVLVIASLLFLTNLNARYWKDDLTYCKPWLSRFPDNPIATLRLAEYYFSRHEYAQATRYYTDYLEADSDAKDRKAFNRATVLSSLGFMNFSRGQWKEALHYYTLALDINTAENKSEIFLGLGSTYLKLGNEAQALANYKNALDEDKTSAITHKNLSILFAYQERYRMAALEGLMYDYYNSVQRFEPSVAQTAVLGLKVIRNLKILAKDSNADFTSICQKKVIEIASASGLAD